MQLPGARQSRAPGKRLLSDDQISFYLPVGIAGGGGQGPDVGLVTSHSPTRSKCAIFISKFWRRQGIMSTMSKPPVCKALSRLYMAVIVPLPLPPAKQ
jgi:hypothetical protein